MKLKEPETAKAAIPTPAVVELGTKPVIATKETPKSEESKDNVVTGKSVVSEKPQDEKQIF